MSSTKLNQFLTLDFLLMQPHHTIVLEHAWEHPLWILYSESPQLSGPLSKDVEKCFVTNTQHCFVPISLHDKGTHHELLNNFTPFLIAMISAPFDSPIPTGPNKA